MITKTVRGGRDAWVDSNHASRNHGGTPNLQLLSGAKQAFIFMRSPAPRGTTVVSAKLQFHAHGASSGTRTLTVRRIGSKWGPNKITWNHKPGVTGTAVTTSIGTVADGDLIEFDVTSHLQTVANGSHHYGWRIDTDATTMHKLYSLNAGRRKPVLVVEFTYKPDYADNLNPAGGAVSVAAPTLQYDYNDTSGKIDLVGEQVQIDPAANWSSPAFDSGTVDTTEPELDLSTTGYLGLADAATTSWRVRVKGSDGVWSDWSDPASFSRAVKPTLTVTSPAAAPGDVVTEPTPPIVWTFTPQTAYQVIVTDPVDHSKVLHNSGKRPGADQQYTLPKDVLTTPGGRYSVVVRCWDDKDRVATPGDPTYAHVRQDFTFNYDATPDPVTGLTVTRPDAAPRLRLTWTRSSTPDSYVIERDGVVVDADLSDLLISGTTYQYDDWAATPWETHTYRVRPVVNGAAADNSPAVSASWRCRSPYLADPDTGAWFTLLEASPNLSYGEDAQVNPRGGTQVTRKMSSMRGLEGDVSGVLVENDWDPRTLDEQLADVYTLKGRCPVGRYRFVWGDLNVPVIAGNINPAPSSDTTEEGPRRAVSFSIWQDGELPFTIEV